MGAQSLDVEAFDGFARWLRVESCGGGLGEEGGCGGVAKGLFPVYQQQTQEDWS